MNFNWGNLPTYGYLTIYVTADRMTSEDSEFGTPAESGWVDKVGSTDIQESRNYVEPVYHYPVHYIGDDEIEEFQNVIKSLGGYDTDDGTSLYALDSVTLDYADSEGSEYSYALHAHVKYFRYAPFSGAGEYVEEPFDMTSDLSGLTGVTK